MAPQQLLDELVRASAAPDSVRLVADQLFAAFPHARERLESEPALASRFAAVAAASHSLSRVIVTDPAALDVLSELDTPSPGAIGDRAVLRWDPAKADDAEDLVRRKQLSLLEVATRDLNGLSDLEQVTGSLSVVGDRVLAGAIRLAGAGNDLAVIAMGKHGAEELNYSSDIDILLVASDGAEVDPALARVVVAISSRAFRIDTNLRPEGRSGVLVRSVESYVAYWERWARPWEFQALLKARHAAGDPMTGRLFEEAASQHLWSRRFGADDLAELRTMKARAEAVVSKRGLDNRELKRGRGGIRDVEFSVQLLQLVHGGRDPALRLRATLPCLAELADAGYVAAEDAGALAIAYRFLRTVEHRLQLVEEAQVHTVPVDRASRDRLARVLGFRGRPMETPCERFDAVLARHQAHGKGNPRTTVLQAPARGLRRQHGPQGACRTELPGRRRARPGGGCRRQSGSPPSASADADRTRQALSELTAVCTRCLAADAAAAAAPARLALGVTGPRPGSRRAPGRSPAPRTGAICS